MKICVPIEEDLGLRSPVCSHFGSAPAFLIVDTDTGEAHTVANGRMHEGHGQCRPIDSIRDQGIDCLVVGGIGRGALAKLRAEGIDVYLTDRDIVDDVLGALAQGALRPVDPEMTCKQHRHDGHDCGHEHAARD